MLTVQDYYMYLFPVIDAYFSYINLLLIFGQDTFYKTGLSLTQLYKTDL